MSRFVLDIRVSAFALLWQVYSHIKLGYKQGSFILDEGALRFYFFFTLISEWLVILILQNHYSAIMKIDMEDFYATINC